MRTKRRSLNKKIKFREPRPMFLNSRLCSYLEATPLNGEGVG
ncbi:hypothetical protein DB42_BV00070 [Neochlamydia sp. EPS4]|nr:hypothetical protein DB42_BV00070 [Neochlamydia sp. EPS4]